MPTSDKRLNLIHIQYQLMNGNQLSRNVRSLHLQYKHIHYLYIGFTISNNNYNKSKAQLNRRKVCTDKFLDIS